MPATNVPPSSTKPWSEIVDEADTEPEDNTAYVFSNGRRFENPEDKR